jgi:hypothetical protein
VPACHTNVTFSRMPRVWHAQGGCLWIRGRHGLCLSYLRRQGGCHVRQALSARLAHAPDLVLCQGANQEGGGHGLCLSTDTAQTHRGLSTDTPRLAHRHTAACAQTHRGLRTDTPPLGHRHTASRAQTHRGAHELCRTHAPDLVLCTHTASAPRHAPNLSTSRPCARPRSRPLPTT